MGETKNDSKKEEMKNYITKKVSSFLKIHSSVLMEKSRDRNTNITESLLFDAIMSVQKPDVHNIHEHKTNRKK